MLIFGGVFSFRTSRTSQELQGANSVQVLGGLSQLVGEKVTPAMKRRFDLEGVPQPDP